MSESNIEKARRGYSALGDAYRRGDITDLIPFAEEVWEPGLVVTATAGFPETGEWHGREGLLEFIEAQTDSFSEMWIEPQEYIESDDKVVVPLRFGGRARHTGIALEFSAVHVWTMCNGKGVRLDMYGDRAKALEAAGLSE